MESVREEVSKRREAGMGGAFVPEVFEEGVIRMGKTWRKRHKPIRLVEKEVKTYTCNICGCKIVPDSTRKYIAAETPAKGGFSAALAGQQETQLYDAIDCKKCGCQLLLKKRVRYASQKEIGDRNETL